MAKSEAINLLDPENANKLIYLIETENPAIGTTLWMHLLFLYNKETNSKLSPWCKPCFMKAFRYFKAKQKPK